MPGNKLTWFQSIIKVVCEQTRELNYFFDDVLMMFNVIWFNLGNSSG